MLFSIIALLLSAAATAVAQTACTTPVGSGVCQYTNSTCTGGSYVHGACPGATNYQCCVAGASSGNLPGLDPTQSANAHAVIGQNTAQGLGQQGCLAAITTGLTESAMKVLANNAVPSSLNYPHNGIGKDHDSIGIFQQRASIYTNIAADMDPAQSASEFFTGMTAISGWQTMNVPALCQKVQKSAVPSAYQNHYAAAQSICSAAGY